MNPLNTNIRLLSNELLDCLIDFKKQNPDFTFALRQRDEKGRLTEKGQWFQGADDYIAVPLFIKGDRSRIKTISFILRLNKKTAEIDGNYIHVVFKGNKHSENEINFYNELANQLNIKLVNRKGNKDYSNPNDYLNNLRDYITNTRHIAMGLLKKYNLQDQFIISNEKFKTTLKKIINIRSKSHTANNKIPNKTSNMSLNLILYGPPGTGKTYESISKAVEIADKKYFDFNSENRLKISERFKELLYDPSDESKGQIGFITFHQSMSYEDFIEGLKPDSSNVENGITYDIEDGIFKTLSRLAKDNAKSEDNFDTCYNKLLDEIADNNDALILNTLKRKKAFTIYENSKGNLRFHANTDKAYEGVIKKEFVSTYLRTGVVLDWKSYTMAVGDYIRTKYNYSKNNSTNAKNYVLIIDEINRGNISQIFGELITLIEVDKRMGQSESIELILTYSKRKFSVPSNLYIIGTMNTADRSVEALDTALRRRFDFIKITPKPYLLTPIEMIRRMWNHPDYLKFWWDEEPYRSIADSLYGLLGCEKSIENKYDSKKYENKYYWSTEDMNHIDQNKFTGLNFEKLLSGINSRIEYFLDEDHMIGHSYFMAIYSELDLRFTFKNKIIPLLCEYFYNDYGKIRMIVGENFITKMNGDQIVFASDDEDFETERTIYKIVDIDDSFDIISACKNLMKY